MALGFYDLNPVGVYGLIIVMTTGIKKKQGIDYKNRAN
jgi:hypothetical protein